MPWPYLFDPENPEYDPFAPYAREEQPPEMPPPVEVPDVYSEQAPVQEERPLPSSVLPFQSLPNPSLQEYQEHIETQPTREAHRPGTLETILGALSSGAIAYGSRNPMAGMETFNKLYNTRYNEAMEDWSTKGKALETAAAQEGKTLGESVQFRLGQIKDETARAQLEARSKDIQNRYEIGMKNATTAAERAAVLKAAQEEMGRFHKDLIGVRKTEAGASVAQAEAAKTRAGASVTAAEAAKTRAEKATQSRTLSGIDQVRIMRLAQDAVMAEMPEAAKFIDTDENGKIIGWKDAPTGDWDPFKGPGWSPEDAATRAKVIKRFNELREEALKELNTRSITAEPPPYFPE